MFSQKENESKYPVNRQIYTACSSKVQFHDILLSGFTGASCADKKKKTNRKKQQQIKKNKKRKQDRLTIVTDGLTDRLTDRSKTYIVDFFKFFFSRNTEQIPSFGKGLKFVLE